MDCNNDNNIHYQVEGEREKILMYPPVITNNPPIIYLNYLKELQIYDNLIMSLQNYNKISITYRRSHPLEIFTKLTPLIGMSYLDTDMCCIIADSWRIIVNKYYLKYDMFFDDLDNRDSWVYSDQPKRCPYPSLRLFLSKWLKYFRTVEHLINILDVLTTFELEDNSAIIYILMHQRKNIYRRSKLITQLYLL